MITLRGSKLKGPDDRLFCGRRRSRKWYDCWCLVMRQTVDELYRLVRSRFMANDRLHLPVNSGNDPLVRVCAAAL